MFRRVALTGSGELFRNTSQPAPLPTASEPAVPLGLPREDSHEQRYPVETYYQYSLTEAQVQTLIDALQKIKYPHNLKSTSRPSMEDFERLEGLRQILLDGLR